MDGMEIMDCERIAELLPWLANNTLEADQQQVAREHLALCLDCRRELKETFYALAVHSQHIPAEALTDYAFERPLPTMDSSLVERHLKSCPDCAEQLEMVRESRLLIESEPVQITAPVARRRLWRSLPGWQYAAMAASILAFIMVGVLLWTEQQKTTLVAQLEKQQREASEALARLEAEKESAEAENKRLRQFETLLQEQQREADREIAQLREQISRLGSPQVNVLTLDVYPSELTERGERAAVNEISIPGNTGVLTLILNSQSSTTHPSYRLEIVNDQKRIVWSARGLARQSTGDYTINIPTRFLPPGNYTINVYGQSRGRPEKVESYAVRIKATAR